ncbi:MAG: FmdB family zinc ribbon protein [Cuniculiplasma sp.]
MEKYVHIWIVKCANCGNNFEHIFRARDILKPHIFNELLFKCPSCGARKFDLVKPLKKEQEDQWKEEHPNLRLEDLPDYSYVDI